MGFVGGSDCYTGRPGDDHPGHQLRRYQKAGLTGLYASDLSLEAVMAAMKARRVYATSGVRIVAAVAADGNLMGAEYSTNRPPTVSVKVIGTGPLERVELFRGLDLVHTEKLARGPSADRVRVTWEGASRRTSYSGVVWDGSVSLDGGRISDVRKIRFDSPRSEVTESEETRVRWHSWTCGYRSGLVFDVDADPATAITATVSSEVISGSRYGGHGESAPQRMSFAPADRVHIRSTLGSLADGARKIDLGVLDRKFTLEMAPEPGPDRVEFDYTDESPQPGINPYWVRVTPVGHGDGLDEPGVRGLRSAALGGDRHAVPVVGASCTGFDFTIGGETLTAGTKRGLVDSRWRRAPCVGSRRLFHW